MNDKILISPQKYFKLEDGRIIKNISELSAALEHMTTELFLAHAGREKNDFASWVREVFGEFDLSNYMKEAKTKEEMIRVLRAYLPKDTVQTAKFEMKKADTTKTEKTDQSVRNSLSWHTEKPVLKEINTQTSETQNTESKETIKKPHMVEPAAIKPVTIHKAQESDADLYFQEHPIMIDQMVESKKESLSYDKLAVPTYSGNESPERLIEVFKENYVKAYERLVFLRKNGFGTKLCEIMLFRIPSKVKVYDATKQDKDAIFIKRYLNEVIQELNAIDD